MLKCSSSDAMPLLHRLFALSAEDGEEFDRSFLREHVGLVKSVNHAQRTATVLWHKHEDQQQRFSGMSLDDRACLSDLEHLAVNASIRAGPGEQPEEEVVSVYTIRVRHFLQYAGISIIHLDGPHTLLIPDPQRSTPKNLSNNSCPGIVPVQMLFSLHAHLPAHLQVPSIHVGHPDLWWALTWWQPLAPANLATTSADSGDAAGACGFEAVLGAGQPGGAAGSAKLSLKWYWSMMAQHAGTWELDLGVHGAQPSFEYEETAVGSVVAKLDFKAAADEGRLPSSVGSLLRLDGFSALVHWLDGTESMVRLDEVCSFSGQILTHRGSRGGDVQPDELLAQLDTSAGT